MNAIKYIKEKYRMCEKYPLCGCCPLREINKEGTSCDTAVQKHAEEAVSVVEKWSKEHPVVTNGQKIVELMTGERCIERTPYCVSIHVNADWWDSEYKEERDD